MDEKEFLAAVAKLIPTKPDSVAEWMALEMLHVLDETATLPLRPKQEQEEEEAP